MSYTICKLTVIYILQVSSRLRPGGQFISTTIDSRALAKKLSESVFAADDSPLLAYTRAAAATTATAATASGRGECTFEGYVAHCRREHIPHHVSFTNALGDTLLRISFDADSGWERLLSTSRTSRTSNSTSHNGCDGSNSNGSEDSGFGIRYTFSLFDKPPTGDESADQAAVNAPEYIVPLGPAFYARAAEVGL